jgi:hypothetical protein
MDDDRRRTSEDAQKAHERKEWAHSGDREHQWEAREHARLGTRARRALGDSADAPRGKHQKRHE